MEAETLVCPKCFAELKSTKTRSLPDDKVATCKTCSNQFTLGAARRPTPPPAPVAPPLATVVRQPLVKRIFSLKHVGLGLLALTALIVVSFRHSISRKPQKSTQVAAQPPTPLSPKEARKREVAKREKDVAQYEGAIKLRVESSIRKNLQSPKSASFVEHRVLSDKKVGLVYESFGKVTAKNAFGVELTQSFRAIFVRDKFTDKVLPVFMSLDHKPILDLKGEAMADELREVEKKIVQWRIDNPEKPLSEEPSPADLKLASN